MQHVERPSDRNRPRRADARRNHETLLDAAAVVFVRLGVHAPVRDIAAEANVGIGTIYRHFPTRPDLVVAVYRHQIDVLAAAGPELLAASTSAFEALKSWMAMFVDFLITKHGLANALRADLDEVHTLQAEFLQRLVPVCSALQDAALASGDVADTVPGYELMRAVGNLCIGADSDPHYNAQRMVLVLLNGLSAGPVR